MSASLAAGDAVQVTAYGLGARLMDVGRTGTVLRAARTRLVVQFTEDPNYPAEVRSIDPACLRRA